MSKEAKESLNAKLEELKPEKVNYYDKREERKYKEEMRKKEASEFIKKLKMEK